MRWNEWAPGRTLNAVAPTWALVYATADAPILPAVQVGDAAAGTVSSMFSQGISGAAFLGAATFGEQGCFPGPKAVNRHGNLMCDAMLFES